MAFYNTMVFFVALFVCVLFGTSSSSSIIVRWVFECLGEDNELCAMINVFGSMACTNMFLTGLFNF